MNSPPKTLQSQEKNKKRAAEIDRRVGELRHSSREAGKTLVAKCLQSGILHNAATDGSDDCDGGNDDCYCDSDVDVADDDGGGGGDDGEGG